MPVFSTGTYIHDVPSLSQWSLAGLMLLAAPPPPGEPAPLTLRIVSPQPLYLVGRTRVVAEASAPVAYMILTIDGRQLAPDAKPPYAWDIDFGGSLERHRVELAATGPDGGRRTLSLVSAAHPFVEAVGVDLVLVPTVVRHGPGSQRAGDPVTGLTAADFAILEDGAPQPIASFSTEPLPASIGIALDNSASMERDLWSAQKAVAQFIETQPAYSAFSFLLFNDQVFLEQDFTLDRPALLSAVAAARPEGSRTALYDALRIGARHLSARPGARVLVIFTDGEDTVYEADEGRLRTAIDEAQASDVTVFAIAYGGRAAASLGKMAAETGGETIPARGAADLRQAFGRLTEALGSRYLLGYAPPSPGRKGYRKIEVRVARPDVTVLSRTGYLLD